MSGEIPFDPGSLPPRSSGEPIAGRGVEVQHLHGLAAGQAADAIREYKLAIPTGDIRGQVIAETFWWLFDRVKSVPLHSQSEDSLSFQERETFLLSQLTEYAEQYRRAMQSQQFQLPSSEEARQRLSTNHLFDRYRQSQRSLRATELQGPELESARLLMRFAEQSLFANLPDVRDPRELFQRIRSEEILDEVITFLEHLLDKSPRRSVVELAEPTIPPPPKQEPPRPQSSYHEELRVLPDAPQGIQEPREGQTSREKPGSYRIQLQISGESHSLELIGGDVQKVADTDAPFFETLRFRDTTGIGEEYELRSFYGKPWERSEQARQTILSEDPQLSDWVSVQRVLGDLSAGFPGHLWLHIRDQRRHGRDHFLPGLKATGYFEPKNILSVEQVAGDPIAAHRKILEKGEVPFIVTRCFDTEAALSPYPPQQFRYRPIGAFIQGLSENQDGIAEALIRSPDFQQRLDPSLRGLSASALAQAVHERWIQVAQGLVDEEGLATTLGTWGIDLTNLKCVILDPGLVSPISERTLEANGYFNYLKELFEFSDRQMGLLRNSIGNF